MSLSAKQLGAKLYLNSQEMNVLLKEEGFLDGEPGDYHVTDKGRPYAYETGWSNGYGGYAARGYNYIVWDESILNVIDVSEERLASIRIKTKEERRRRREENNKIPDSSINYNESNLDTTSNTNDSGIELLVGGVAIIGTLCYGIYNVAKKVKQFYEENF